MTTQIPVLSLQVKKPVVYDYWLSIAIILLLITGVMVIASSSMEFANRNMGGPFAILLRHLIYMTLGLVSGAVIMRIPVDVWQKFDWILLLIGIVLLLLVLTPGIGSEINGSKRWIRFGPIGMQPSELMKWFLIIYVSGYLVRRAEEVRNQWSGFLKPIVVLAFIIVLLLLEPDFGAMVVAMSAVLGMMFLGGVRANQFFVLITACSGAVAFIATAQEYRMQRLLSFMDPWASENVYGSGYQLTQALIAFGRGEWTGVGLGNSMLKLFYLPEAHTDFVFAILGEEFGLIGVLFVLTLFALLIGRIFYIGWLAERRDQLFGAYACYGIALLMAMQAVINMGVNTALLPTKGLTLPLLSYGGSSLVVTLAMFGFVMAVYQATQIPELQEKEELEV